MYTGTHEKSEVFRLFGEHVSSGRARFFAAAGIDFVLGRRDGPYLWDLDGTKQLINVHCNGGVFNLGHRHPQVVAVMRAALEELDIGNHHLVSEQRAALGAKLARLMPGELSYTVFGVSGGEAVDLAIKVARAHTRRTTILSAKGGYHGHTGLALAAGDEKFRAPFGPPAPGFVQVPFNDVAALEQAIDDDTAAVILETIPATSGICVPDDGYLAAVRELCDRRGALWIADEVQTGLGRTGRLWGFEHAHVVPDMVVIGKGLSGGLYPMSATCLRAPLERVFHADPFIHVSTFGGAELGCPVASRVLDISSDPAFLRNVRDMAVIFRDGFAELAARHRVLVRLRQQGLMMGIEMADPRCGPAFTKAAYDHGLFALYAANDTRVAQLLPPLTCDRGLAVEILRRVDGALGAVGALVG